MSASTTDILETVRSTIQQEIVDRRARGVKLAHVFPAIGRLLGIAPRRVRAFHHNEIAVEDVRALEWLAARELQTKRRRERIAAARVLLATEGVHDED